MLNSQCKDRLTSAEQSQCTILVSAVPYDCTELETLLEESEIEIFSYFSYNDL